MGVGISNGHSEEGFSRKRAISRKLTVVARQLHMRFDQSVASIGITRSQWTMVAVIARRPGATQREVAEALEVSEASAGRLIDRLCADGLLVRRRKEDDRRAHCVFLTDAAKPIMQKISVIGKEYEDLLMKDLVDTDLVAFERYLDVVAANLAKAPNPK